jgi:hypothetical protein
LASWVVFAGRLKQFSVSNCAKKHLSGKQLTEDLSIGCVGVYAVHHWEREFPLRKIFRETFI